MSMEIDWRKIKKTSEGDRNEFEHFCDHIFARHFSEIGIYERFYNTPGSESYIEVPQSIQYKGVELASGDVIGLQAKFWLGPNDDTFTPINSKRIEELKERLSELRMEFEELQSDLETEAGDIEPYEGRYDLTELQQQRQEWLEATASTIEETVMSLQEAEDNLDYVEE